VDFKIDTGRLAGARLFVGCPMYDGRCHAEFAFALCQLSALCTQLGVPLQIFFASGEALVMKARNAIADQFLRSDATHLMLIDADIGFQALDVMALLELQLGHGGQNAYDVLSAPYPIKRIAWDKVAQAEKLGLAKGDASALRHFAAKMLLHPAQGGSFDMAHPIEVTQAGTGFMMIRRRTLERFQAHYPHRRYKSENIGVEQNGSPVIAQFFDSAIDGAADTLEDDLRALIEADPEAGRSEILAFLAARNGGPQDYVSEDFMFCRLVRRMGLKVWTCPWVTLSHTGSFTYAARLADVARLGPIG
jgi:hypothetical protein